MKNVYMNQFAASCTAAASDARSCSRACESTACAQTAVSMKDAFAASFIVLFAVLVSALRLCRVHIMLVAGLLISLLVWRGWKTAEVQWMQ